MLGYSVDEMIGKLLFAFMDEEWQVVAERKVERRRRGIKEQHDFKFCRKDGTELWALVSTVPIFDTDGRYAGALGMITDITKRKRAEEALKESESRYRGLFDNASESIIISDLQGNIVEANRAAVALFGYPLEELEGMNMARVLAAESLEAATERQPRRAMGEAIADRHEYRVVKKDGTEVIVESATQVITADGQPVALHIIARDVTEERRLRENMQFYIDEITKAREEERKRIARELHDETTQALATLLLDIEAITRARGQLSEETLMQLEQLREKTEAIMDGVRRFSHELRPGELDQLGLLPALESLAEDMIISYGIDARIRLVGTERRLPPEVELVLFRIAQEALRNVRKHSQATKAVVRVEFTPEKVRLDVTDNGCGFELLERIGDFASMGKLGILGMHERARLIDGSISVESEAGKGTMVAVEVAG